MKGKIFLFLVIILSVVIIWGMASRIVSDIDSSVIPDEILKNYNEMNYRWIVSNYFEFKDKVLSFSNRSEVMYAVVVSLYRFSNYNEVLNFTNFYFEPILMSNVMLLASFSLSEIGEFELSDRWLNIYSTNSFYYLSDLVEYYKFRNSLYSKREYIPSVSVAKFLKSEDVDLIVSNITSFSDNFSIFVSREISSLKKNPRVKELVLQLLNKKYSKNFSIVSVSRNLIRAGFYSDGVRLILTASIPNIVRNYYRAFLLLENKQFKEAKVLISSLISQYDKNKEVFRDYGISFDDVLVLNLRLYSNTSSKDFNDEVVKYIRVGGVKFLEYVLRNNKILTKDVYFLAITNYFSKVELNYSTKAFCNSFISYNLQEGNIYEVKKFSDYMLKRTRNTAWGKEFIFLNFLLEQDYNKKLDIAKNIVLNYPFTYEYISVMKYLERNKEFLNDFILEVSSNYIRVFERYSTNSNINDLNTMIGVKFFLEHFGVYLSNDFDVFREVSKFSKQILPLYISSITDTNNVIETETNEVRLFKKLSHIKYLVSRNLLLDLHLEVRKLIPKPSHLYLDEFRKYGMIDYVCRAYERLGMYRDNIYANRAVVILSFLKELYPTPYIDKVSMYSSKYSVDKSLVYSVMRQESKYSPYVTSIANAMGLMQLILPTADTTAKRFWNTKDPITSLDVYSVDNNINLGVAHLSELIQFFSKYPKNFQEILVVSSYNAGMTAVRRWYDSLKTDNEMLFVEAIRFHETKEYTKIVIENKFIYENFVFTDDKIVIKNKN